MIQSGHFVSTSKCIGIIIYLVYTGLVQGFYINTYYKVGSEIFPNDNSIEEKFKTYLRSKKRELKPLFINDSNEEKENSLNNVMGDDDSELLGKYPICEAKYKLVDKLKVINFLEKLMEKRKKIIFNKSCLTETYEVLLVTLKNTNDLLSVLATVYGFIPHFLIFIILFGFFITFNKILLYFVLIIPTQMTLNDLILKNIFKMRRPNNSALKSYGMPSGHSSFSYSILTFTVLHLIESHKDKWNIIASLLALITLFPIPWSRVYIEDHTVSQVIVGIILGVILGCLFFLFKRILFKYKYSKF
ncbi:PAP2-like protein, putative [Plasmodium gallinaceum]|uniref:PAP2-like protein, putative n=1 Tax=Plasmodium gallinaceum TaxID=5849 RepID=A0A1J1GLS0_PLAGA|nr:PAP2-like protein, putative [Plasmodium gallinaceum]CRG93376.1 PAP2-like protein, putative [Plasmodium gallinaceum]